MPPCIGTKKMFSLRPLSRSSELNFDINHSHPPIKLTGNRQSSHAILQMPMQLMWRVVGQLLKLLPIPSDSFPVVGHDGSAQKCRSTGRHDQRHQQKNNWRWGAACGGHNRLLLQHCASLCFVDRINGRCGAIGCVIWVVLKVPVGFRHRKILLISWQILVARIVVVQCKHRFVVFIVVVCLQLIAYCRPTTVRCAIGGVYRLLVVLIVVGDTACRHFVSSAGLGFCES